MDVQFYGANCVTITNKNARVVIDDNLSELGGKSITKPGDIMLATGAHGAPTQESKLFVDQPGEYEVAGISVIGVPARAHIDIKDQKTATMYKLLVDDIKILVTGHIYPELTEAQLEAIGMVDVMIVPVGGHGYTLDPIGAMTLVKKVEPKLVIPTHYADSALHFPVEQTPLDEALKSLAIEVKETTAKLKLKPADLGETTETVVLEKS